MFYYRYLTVPKGTSSSAPVESTLPLHRGTISRGWVGFPAGCAGLVHVQVWRRGWQLWPWTRGEDLAWDGYVFSFAEHFELQEEPYQLLIKAWNTDDTYAHDIFVGVALDTGVTDEQALSKLSKLVGLG